ncbi:MAG: hypothetical protein AAFR56_14830 [Chloroflexota bacterium]
MTQPPAENRTPTRYLLFIAVVMGVLLLLAFPLLYLAAFEYDTGITQARMKRTFELYPDATPLWEDTAYYLNNQGTRKVFYVTEARIDTVQAHYETVNPPLEQMTSGDYTWLETGYRLSNRESLTCDWSFAYEGGNYNCTQLFLIASDTPDISRSVPFKDGSLPRRNLPQQFDTLPEGGTVIVYEYWIRMASDADQVGDEVQQSVEQGS